MHPCWETCLIYGELLPRRGLFKIVVGHKLLSISHTFPLMNSEFDGLKGIKISVQLDMALVMFLSSLGFLQALEQQS